MRFRGMSLLGVEFLLGVPDNWGDTVRRAFRLPDRSLKQHGNNWPTDPPAPDAAESTEAQRIKERVRGIDRWYHTIDLGHGVITPGGFDHRQYLSLYPIPERLTGLRVLDVATFDGFWAFEMERRSAAEVVAVDLDTFGSLDMPAQVRKAMTREEQDRPIGQGFALCHELLRSNVRREVISVYDLGPDRLGTFDFVFVSDLLLHLMNPMKALQNVCTVTNGTALIVETFDPSLPGNLMEFYGGARDYTWWKMSLGALERMVRDAGFSSVELVSKFRIGHRNEDAWMPHAAFVCKS